MNHLMPDEFVDLVEGTLESARHEHLDACAACRREADRLGAVLADARLVAMPEPSPLFWEHFSRRVTLAIAEEPAVQPSAVWCRWPVLLPVSALTLLVFALITAVPRTPAVIAPLVEINDSSGLEPEPDGTMDSAWTFILESVGPLDVEAAQQAGIAASLGEAERAALHLTDAEQIELVRLLEHELTRTGS